MPRKISMELPKPAPVKKRDTKKILIRLGKYLYTYKWLVLLALLLTVGSNLFELIGPMLSGRAIDAIGDKTGGVNFEQVFFYCALMIAFYLVSSLLSYCLSILMIHISQKTVHKMRKDVFEKLLSLPVSYFDSHQTGDIISKISYDIDTVNASLSTDLIQICTSIITVLGSLIMMLTISPVLILVFVVTIPVAIFFTKFMTTRVRPLFRQRSKKLGELNGYVEEMISGQKTITAYNRQKEMVKRFDVKNNDALDAYYKADYYGTMTGPGVNFVNNLSMALISIFGAILYLFKQITIGNLSSFVLYSRKFSGPINETANIISEFQSTCAAAERIFNLLDELEEAADREGAYVLDNPKGLVEMEHINFSYDQKRTIIHDLSLTAKEGSLIAIVGPTGAGKTTIINLLMRFYDPVSGKIMIDKHDTLDVTRKSLRLSFAMVLQDTWLFSDTVYQNIAYGKKDATMEDVVKAAKAAKIHDYIMQLPNGYDTILTEDGINISQGQKQLITIARAMLLDANMLILDEATSNVDTRTELYIQEAMRTLMKDKTCFVIAHRLSTIQNADMILVVKDGDIVEQGKHKELLAKNGFYAELYKAQFSN